MNRFIISMAWRETRGAWRHFIYFFICIAVGVGALVGVSLFAAHVERAVKKEARGLLGGDLEVRSSRPLNAVDADFLLSLGNRGIVSTNVSELVAMASRKDGVPDQRKATQIIELKAVEPRYPLYGALRLEPASSLIDLLHPSSATCNDRACHGAVVQETLLLRMGLSIGDSLKIGQATFIISGVVRIEPDRVANAFSLGPRVIISQQGLRDTDLIKPGSRVRERHLIRLPEGEALEPLRAELRTRLSAGGVRVSGYRDAQPQLKQFLDQLARYLGLIGLTSLFIGGLGVAVSIHSFLQEKQKSIAILKALGMDSSTIIQIYILQSLGLGLMGSITGLVLGILLQYVLPPLIAGVFVTDLLEQLGASAGLSVVSVSPLIKGMALGLLATLLFTLWPLLRIRDIRPMVIFRQEIESSAGENPVDVNSWRMRWGLGDRVNLLTVSAVVAGLGGLSIWQAGSWKFGALFLGGLSLAAVLLSLFAGVLVEGCRSLPKPPSLSFRYAVGNITRPGRHSIGILVAISLSVTVIITVSLVEKSLLHQVGESRPADAPTFFFIDLQPDQIDDFTKLVSRETGGRKPELTPLIRSRLHTVNGVAVKIAEEGDHDERVDGDRAERQKQWYLSREYVLTFLDQIPKGNQILRGNWWKPGQVFTEPQVSVEEEAAKSLGLEVGSRLEFDIQGVRTNAEVASIRKVDWGNFSTNFYMILSPGSLDGAPLTYVATINVPSDQEVPLQQAVVDSFPNVSAINVGDVLDNFSRVLDHLALAIQAVAIFCVVTGGLVMAAALSATRYRRLYESVILKTLGATRGLIARAFAAEYAILGLAGGVMAVGLSSVLSWLMLTYLFEISWSLQHTTLITGLTFTIVLALSVGFLSTFHILGERPLKILRHE